MKQLTLAAVRAFEEHGHPTRKAEFLARMESQYANRAFAMLAILNTGKWGRPPTGEVRLA